MTDPRGARTQARYDLADRLIEVQRTAPGSSRPEQTLRLTWSASSKTEEAVYAGTQLTHRTVSRYTLWGQLASQQVMIGAEPDNIVSLSQHLHYSPTGKLLSRTLPDGTRIAYRYYADTPSQPGTGGQLAAIEQIRWPSRLDWLMARLPESWQPKTVLAQLAPNSQATPQPGNAPPVSVLGDAGAPQVQIAPGLSPDAPGEQFDSAGLPHRLTTATGQLQLLWNAAGQLAQVNDAGGKTIAIYSYDAQGRRASKTTAHGSEFYLYEGTQLIATAADGNGPEKNPPQIRITGQYLYQGYRPVAWLKPRRGDGLWHKFRARIKWNDTAAYALATDHRGAVLAVTTLATDPAQRKTLWQSHINAWGAVQASAPTTLDPRLRLVNQYADVETGLSYNIARYYDPAQGRYISPDPAGIADSIDHQTPDSLKLDITVYASGQPYLYFDPDAAAKITYYLIDATPNNTSASPATTQGRWAFWVRGMSGGGSLLYDAGGTFFAQSSLYQNTTLFDSTSPKYASWKDSTMTVFAPKGTDFVRDYINYYLYDMLSPPSFTVNISDQQAATIAADILNSGDVISKYWCDGGKAKLLFPSVELLHHGLLYPGGQEGANDTSPGTLVPQGQDNVLCTEAMTPNRRFDRLKAAIEMQETGGADCSIAGCPANTSNFLGEDASHHPLQPASYGKTQFTAATLIEEVLKSSAPLASLPSSNSANPLGALLQPRYSKNELINLGLVDAAGANTGLKAKLLAADNPKDAKHPGRVQKVNDWKDSIQKIYATLDITKIPNSTLKQFAQDTGLGWDKINVSPPAVPDYSVAKDYYVRIVNYWKLQDIVNPYRIAAGGNSTTAWKNIKANAADYAAIKGLLTQLGMSETGLNPYLRVLIWNEGWNALYNTAIFTDTDVKKWMLTNADSIFKDKTKFDTISDLRMRRMIATFNKQYPKETEENIVTRYANFHNSGSGSLSTTPYSKSVVVFWKQADCFTTQAKRFSLDPKKTP